jgi:hypothetical protein
MLLEVYSRASYLIFIDLSIKQEMQIMSGGQQKGGYRPPW